MFVYARTRRPLVSKEEKIKKKPVRKINSKVILPIVIIIVLAIATAVLLINQNPNRMQDSGIMPVTGGLQTNEASTGADASDTNPGTTTVSADDGSVAPIETGTGADTSETDSTATSTETALGWFEYYDLNGDFDKLEASQIFGKEVHFVVAGDGSSWDVSNHLPITITITHDGSVVWTGTITAEKGDYGWEGFVNCRGADCCSMDGPEISEDWAATL